MQILTEGDWKQWNANSNHSKGIWMLQIQFRTILKEFEAFESKFEPFKRDLKHLNPNSNHSNGIRSIQMQILTTCKGFELFESKF